MSELAALFDLAGRRALITGGSSGIGAAMARALGLAGARVLLVARREAELNAVATQLRGEGIEADTLRADLTHVAALRAAAQRAGEIDILVNAAGTNLRQPFAEVTPEAWQAQLALHLGAPFFSRKRSRPAWPHAAGAASSTSPRCKAIARLPTAHRTAPARAALCSSRAR